MTAWSCDRTTAAWEGAAVSGRRRVVTSDSGQRARGRRVERVGEAERQPLRARPRDHRAVVGAKRGRRHHQHGADLECHAVENFPHRVVRRHPAGGDQRGRRAAALAEQLQPHTQAVGDDVHHRLLERGAKIAHVLMR